MYFTFIYFSFCIKRKVSYNHTPYIVQYKIKNTMSKRSLLLITTYIFFMHCQAKSTNLRPCRINAAIF